MRILITLALSLLAAFCQPAQAQQLIGPYRVKFCAGNVHAWVYSQSASGVVTAPGPSCPASAGCLSPSQIAAKLYEFATAANPVAAAASANDAALAFTCDATVRAGTDWKAALCRERQQFIQANIKADIGLDPVDGPTAEPSCISAPVVAAYVVSTAQAFPLTATGAKSNTPWPVAPKLGEPCDTSFRVLSFGTPFYRVPSLSATQTVVAGCKAKP